MRRSVPIAILCGVTWHAWAADARAQDCAQVAGQLISIDGDVEIQRDRVSRVAVLDQDLCQRDIVRTGPQSRAAVMLINDAVLRLDQDTTIYLADIAGEEEERSVLDLVRGAFQSFSRNPRELEVNTPYLNATIEGTEFVIRTSANDATMTVYEGVVSASNDSGDVSVESGQSVRSAKGAPPQSFTLVNPRDAVQWGLFYPPILAAGGARSGPIYDAAHLLSVGRVDEARASINATLARGENPGLAYALRAVIAVVQNDREAALSDATRAVELEPDATAPRIALSLAQQAQFDLLAARDTMLEATARQPNDAIGWARLSELWLMLGYRDLSREAAETAVSLDPNIERTQIVLGYAALTEFRTKQAREAFERAIALDSSDPQARFGLGLAMIRDGNLAEGRRQIEMAVALDSSRSLLRSYLGKAYFEEHRDDLAQEQFQLAKELDPLDPTPYLYNAIMLQTENRPVEALHELQTSIDLNDNRAIYRSRELLDSDRAARGASLARVYDDLGFRSLGLNEGAQSLTIAPNNASAHRFLSDMYIGIPRRESARVSEMLQSQLLQDVNINPIQPSLVETNLNIVARGGPADPGFDEFTPLFERNGGQVIVSGVVGNDESIGGEGVASLIYNQLSLGAGAFTYESDGWRPNNDVQHDIFQLYGQVALTPELNIQAEWSQRETEYGDLAFNFDPDSYDPTVRNHLNRDMARIGVRYSPTPNSDIIASVIYGSRDQRRARELFPGFDFKVEGKDEGYQYEGQYIYRADLFNVVAGVGYTDADATTTAQFGPFPPFVVTDSPITHFHGYTYVNISLPETVTWTVGASYDDYEEGPLKVEKVNPKFGVQWKITDDLVVRGAAFRTVKPALVANRSIEPTQIAGFNQLFDDGNADEAWRYGGAIDYQITDDLFIGAEFTWRDLTVPVFIPTGVTFEDQEEQLGGAYLYWAINDRWALSGRVSYDRFQTGVNDSSVFGDVPLKVETFSVPIMVRYFHPSGFFAGLGGTYVNQDVTRTFAAKTNLGLADGSDDFFVVDAAIGFRFPDRRGIASLTVSNLLDEEFFYQDDSFREFRDEPSIGPYLPAMQIVGRITLNF